MGKMVKALLCDGEVTITLLKSTNIVSKAIDLFDLSPVAAAALGRTLTMTSLLANDLKNKDDKMTVIINGNGEIGAITVTATNNGKVKGFVGNPQVQTFSTKNGKLDVAKAVGIDGKITVIKNLGFDQPYIGTGTLVSGEIAEDFANYLAQSEQVACAVSLGVLIGTSNECISAGGAFAQVLPGVKKETINKIEEVFSKLNNISSQFDNCATKEFLYLYFGHLQPVILSEKNWIYKCDCEKRRIDRVLKTLTKRDVDEIVCEKGAIEIVCQFCGKKYLYSKDDAYGVLGIGKKNN